MQWGPFLSCGPGDGWLWSLLGVCFEREASRVQDWLGVAAGLGCAGKDQLARRLKAWLDS